MPTWHKIPKLHLTGTVIICRTGFSSKAYRAQSPSLLSFIDENKHCEHPSTQTVHWADSAHVSKAPPGWDISDNPKSSKAPEQRCAMDSSDTWIREQLRQIRTSQCCVSEITQLPLSLPQWRELKPWKQQSHISKMLSLPVTATPACQQDWVTQAQPHSIRLGCLGYVSCTTGPCSGVLCTETYQLIHSWLLIICMC